MLTIIVFIASMACVSATDVHNFDEISTNDDVINLDDGNYVATHSLEVNHNLTINGNGQTINGNNLRFLTINENATVYLNDLTLTNCQVKDHNAFHSVTVKGGAIVNHGTLYINNCKFLKNSVESGEYGYGGVIYSTGILEIANSTFTDNYVLTYTSSIIENDGYGGAIYNENTCKISNCNFENNNVNKDHNKADYSYGGAIANVGFMEINDSNFLNNVVNSKGFFCDHESYGGALYNSGTLNLRNCILRNNTAYSYSSIGRGVTYGGAIYSTGVINMFGFITCSNNKATHGGAIYSTNSTIANANCLFSNNCADGEGGAIYAEGIISFSKTVKFTNNNAEDGGAIHNRAIAIFDCDSIDFSNNIAKYGNTIYNFGRGTSYINGKAYKNALNDNIIITNGDLNRLAFSRDGNDYVIRYLDCDGKEITDSVKEDIVNGNYKSYTYSIEVNSTYISLIHSEYIYNCTDLANFIIKYIINQCSSNSNHWTTLNLYFNQSTYDIPSSASVFKFVDDDLKQINIYGNGAIFRVINHDDRDKTHFLEVTNSQIALVNNVTCIGFNTAILNNGLLKVESCNFINNRLDCGLAQSFGGAIRNSGILLCLNSTFIGNSAKYGGAIYNADGSYCNIENSTFETSQNGGDVCNFKNVNYTAINSLLNLHTDNGASGLSKILIGIFTTIIDVIITVPLIIFNPLLGVTIWSLSTVGLGAFTGLVFAGLDRVDINTGALRGAMFGLSLVLMVRGPENCYDMRAADYLIYALFGPESKSTNVSDLLKAELKAANYDIQDILAKNKDAI